MCQAEELNVGGKWKRYFGFVSERGGAAVVPASEIELSLSAGWPWDARGNSYSKIDWGITVPGPKPGFWKRQEDETVRVGDPLPLALCVWNGKSRPQEIPATWYKDAQHGGPALLDAFTISLQWAPFDANYPVQRPFAELRPIRTAHFPYDGTKRALPAFALPLRDNQVRLFTLDLRDWFKVKHEGLLPRDGENRLQGVRAPR